ncbi:MAG: glycosyltransferase [Lachnospiraceae bacterium]|nr:glycosyltransferase [Lachnospiraceae bacterium]
MNIIFCYWNSICEPGMTHAFEQLGHHVMVFDHPMSSKDLDTDYLSAFSGYIQSNPKADCVFTINFIPLIAKVCRIFRIPYLSHTVDSPSITLSSKALNDPCCHAFIFDRCLYQEYAALAPDRVHYLPLGADIDFYDGITVSEEDHDMYDCDISFIGSFHSENCIYDRLAEGLPERMRGYIDGLIEAQLNVYGYNLIRDAFSDAWAEEFKRRAAWSVLPDYHEDIRSIITDQYIGFKCTQRDRIRTLQAISQNYRMDLYTTEDTSMLPDINNRGIAKSFTMMPRIFKCSKINLNMTARTIQSGLPQRIFDIMAAGGFVLSNYQSEIPEYFIPGEDIVLYESIPDLLEKLGYYLSHEEERLQIARNGYKKTKKQHLLVHRAQEMLKILS